jgi:methylated-DNA-[protein]-cysteine S-methyltransferase
MKIKIIKSTPFGPVAVAWSTIKGYPQIVRVLISKPGWSAEDQVAQNYPEAQLTSCREIDDVTNDIKAFLKGQDVVFSLDTVTLEMCSPFQKDVLRAEHQIPRGSISTYKLIAEYLDKDKGARAVGNALANNPFPIIVPCHRAIRSDGHLGGFQGGVKMKRVLLENEGVNFDSKGRVVSPRVHYQNKVQ